MKERGIFAVNLGVLFCLITNAVADESVVENETPTLLEILGDRAPLVANVTRTAIGSSSHGILTYGNLGRHFAIHGTKLTIAFTVLSTCHIRIAKIYIPSSFAQCLSTTQEQVLQELQWPIRVLHFLQALQSGLGEVQG